MSGWIRRSRNGGSAPGRPPPRLPVAAARRGASAAWIARAALAAALLAALPGAAQHAVSRHTIDGGAGDSASARYRVRGTVGQPDAHGLLAGPTYRLAGGFWAVLPVDGLFADGFEDPVDAR